MTTNADITNEAINRVGDNAEGAWKHAALETGRLLAYGMRELTAEDVFEHIPPGYATHEKRAMGWVMRQLARENLIEATDRYVKARNPAGHMHPVLVWASKVA